MLTEVDTRKVANAEVSLYMDTDLEVLLNSLNTEVEYV